MARVWYGNLTNRLEENKMFCEEIKVGTGMTEYFYSDRHPYEVVEVTDQKHIKVRALDHQHVGNGSMDNNWELISNENNAVRQMTKRGNYWYWTVTVKSEDFDFDNLSIETRLWFCHQNILIDDLKAKGKITRYHKANVSFGHADYYYDYEF